MMELDNRPHLRNTASTTTTTAPNNELFICFTSRLSSSSSSMKIAKSILSPGRAARDPPISLSTSLSRRLRTNGSIKGGLASPMFPTVGKKKGSGFENPEPSSPKVTCIGQVRVKTKKKVNQTRSLSRRRSAGEVSFRKVEHQQQQQSLDLLRNSSTIEETGSNVGMQQKSVQLNSQQECMNQRNQKWVHLPVTICEALSCLFPCRYSCFSNSEREKGERGEGFEGNNNNGGSGSSCGAVFARWFVSLQEDCEGGKGREIELVVGGGDREEEEEGEKTEVVRQRISMRSSRRHVFEDMEFNDEDVIEVKEEEEKGRVSICVPPKNALLLMRCRSDPMKMESLANRFWESPAPPPEDEDEEEQDDNIEETEKDLKEVCAEAPELTNAANSEEEKDEELASAETSNGDAQKMEKDAILAAEVEELQKDANLVAEMQESVEEEQEDTNLEAEMEKFVVEEQPNTVEELALSDDLESNIDAFEDLLGEETTESSIQWQVEQEGEEERTMGIDASFSCQEEDYGESETESIKENEEENREEATTLEMAEEIQETSSSFEDPTTALFTSEMKDAEMDHKEETYEHQETAKMEINGAVNEGLQEETAMEENKEKKTTSSKNVLPDCLLLMMCEPKLSMEVSKETWVCSTDFIRWLPERPAKKKANNLIVPEETKKKVNNPPNSVPPLPPLRAQAPPQPQRQQQQKQTVQPGRSSCTLPAAAAVSMAAMIEQKLVNAVGYEPFVLTRCKSEPMRTAAAKLLPEACCWNNRKMEPHRNATFGVGATGVGF